MSQRTLLGYLQRSRPEPYSQAEEEAMRDAEFQKTDGFSSRPVQQGLSIPRYVFCQLPPLRACLIKNEHCPCMQNADCGA